MTDMHDLFRPDRLSASDPAPLYLRLEALIRDAIESGQLQAGDALPPEREIATQMQISRVTVRKAFEVLVKAGMVTQRHGSGTYVSLPGRKADQSLSRLSSFSEDIRARGRVPSVRVIDRRQGPPTPEETMVLGLTMGQQVSRVGRLRLEDGVPIAVERASIPDHFLPDPQVVATSLYDTLEERGVRPVRALQKLSAINLTGPDATLLGVAPGAAALRIERVAYLADGRIVEFTRAYYRGDAYDFVAELTLGPET